MNGTTSYTSAIAFILFVYPLFAIPSGGIWAKGWISRRKQPRLFWCVVVTDWLAAAAFFWFEKLGHSLWIIGVAGLFLGIGLAGAAGYIFINGQTTLSDGRVVSKTEAPLYFYFFCSVLAVCALFTLVLFVWFLAAHPW